jgi:hypothetical protein
MAGLYGAFRPGQQSISTTSANVSVLNITTVGGAINQRIRVLGYSIGFNGTNSANSPGIYRIARVTTLGAGGTPVTPVKYNDLSSVAETLQATGKSLQTITTYGDVLDEYTIPVFGGTIVFSYPPGQEVMMPGGSTLSFDVNVAQTVSVDLTVRYEE